MAILLREERMEFDFTGTGPDGRLLRGSVQADNASRAEEQLRAKGVTVSSVVLKAEPWHCLNCSATNEPHRQRCKECGAERIGERKQPALTPLKSSPSTLFPMLMVTAVLYRIAAAFSFGLGALAAWVMAENGETYTSAATFVIAIISAVLLLGLADIASALYWIANRRS